MPKEHPIREEIQDLAERGWAITWDEYSSLQLTVYERNFLVPYVNNETLLKLTQKTMAHCTNPLPGTYEDAVLNHYLPELLERFEFRCV